MLVLLEAQVKPATDCPVEFKAWIVCVSPTIVLIRLGTSASVLPLESGTVKLVALQKLDTAISVIESLNGSGTVGKSNQPTRVISAASRRKMAQAQRARWARAKNASQPVVAIAKTTASAPAKHTLSAAARRKIAAFQRARWAKIKQQQKNAA